MLNDTRYKNAYELNINRKFRPNFSTCQILQQPSLLVLGNTDKNLINQFNHARAYTCTLDCILFYETKKQLLL